MEQIHLNRCRFLNCLRNSKCPKSSLLWLLPCSLLPLSLPLLLPRLPPRPWHRRQPHRLTHRLQLLKPRKLKKPRKPPLQPHRQTLRLQPSKRDWLQQRQARPAFFYVHVFVMPPCAEVTARKTGATSEKTRRDQVRRVLALRQVAAAAANGAIKRTVLSGQLPDGSYGELPCFCE